MRYDLWQAEREKAEVIETGQKVIRKDENGKFILHMYNPKAMKPFARFWFRTVEEREQYITKQIKSFKERLAYKEERKKARTITEPLDIKRGDIFKTSWGYDQTNYDYIAVIEVSATGKTAICQRTDFVHMGQSCQTNEQMPVFSPFGEKFTMQVRPGFRLVGSYPYCHTGEGSRRHDTFSKVSKFETFHETDSRFGH